MERLVKKRKVIRAQITRLINDYENRPQPLDENEAAILHTRLTSWHNELNTVNDEIEPLVTDEDAENEFQQTCEYKDRVVACLARLQRRMTVTSRPTNAESAGNGGASQTTAEFRTRVKLPKFELVKFSGRRSDWQPFWEVFEQVVDKNEELSLIDKFHYLRSSVTGDAAAALAGVPPTSRCYRDAVELLKGRFGNNELLMQEHMRSLLDIKPVRSSDDVRSLRRLYDTLAAHICGLESLGRKLHTYGAMLLPVVQRAMPRDILLDFGRKCATDANSTFDDQRSSSTEGPEPTTPEGDRGTVNTLNKLLSFLKVEVESRENLAALQSLDLKQPSREIPSQKQKSNSRMHGTTAQSSAMLHQNVTPQDCFFCGTSEHATTNCDAAKALEEKRQLLRSSGRCFKCTRRGHLSSACRMNVRCAKCQRKHATTMCDPSYPTRPPDTNDAVASTQISLEAVTNDGTAPKETVLLQTATAQCSGESSNAHVRVMFDGGSQRSYITSLTAQKLGCELVGQERLSVGFFGGHQEERPFRKVKVFLETKRGEKRELEVLETDVICDQTIPKPPKETLEKLEALGYECADSNDHGPKDIGLLIGADYLWDLTTGRTVKLGKRLRAVETAAGWTVQGPVEGSNDDGHCTQTVMLRTSVIEMTSDTLSKHWALESIDVIEGNETTSTALEFFESTLSMATRKDFECEALSTAELNRAELFGIRHEQKKGLLRELRSIQEERQLPADSPLRNTSIMIEEMGVLRISGRLQHSNMIYEVKHPSVPPKESSTANLLIKRCHHQVLHGGIRDTLTQLRSTGWLELDSSSRSP